jgi:hypothetical protein
MSLDYNLTLVILQFEQLHFRCSLTFGRYDEEQRIRKQIEKWSAILMVCQDFKIKNDQLLFL